MKKIFIALFVVASGYFICPVQAQDSIPIMDIPDEGSAPLRIFLAHRSFNGQTVEVLPKGEMKMLIKHRMGEINGGMENFFGLYTATSHIGFDYGFTDKLNGGIGIGNMQRIFDGYLKYKILEQTSGDGSFPFSASWYSCLGYSAAKQTFPDGMNRPWARMYYFHQLLLGRQFGKSIAIQLAPFALHRNLVATTDDKNTVFGLLTVVSIRLNHKLQLTGEYSFVFPNQIVSEVGGAEVQNTFSLGFEYKSGHRHVFHFFVTNSPAINEKIWLGETTQRFRPKHLRIGFNIPTTFRIIK